MKAVSQRVSKNKVVSIGSRGPTAQPKFEQSILQSQMQDVQPRNALRCCSRSLLPCLLYPLSFLLLQGSRRIGFRQFLAAIEQLAVEKGTQKGALVLS